MLFRSIRNSGDKLVSVDQIVVRGSQVPYTNWYVDSNQTTVTSTIFQSQYIYTTTTSAGDLTDSTTWTGTSVCTAGSTIKKIDFDGAGTKAGLCLTQASGPTSLTPGQSMIVYFRVPDAIISPVDAGSSTSVSIFAGKTGAPTAVTVGNP